MRALPLVLVVASTSTAFAEPVSRTRFLMGTTCEIVSTQTSESVESAFAEIARVEGLLSTWREDTELARMNAAASFEPVTISQELFDILDDTQEWSRRTGRAFSPLVAPLSSAWDTRGAGRVPAPAELSEALQASSSDSLTLAAPTRVTLLQGAGIEEGAFGKGYALDRAIEILDSDGCRECFIDFGGQIVIRSESPVRVSIARPDSREREALVVSVSNASISTTSGSEKWFDSPRGRLSHVVDPRTGEALPPRGSATVIHESAFVADILSTALYVMGADSGLEWANENGVAAIFITPAVDGWAVFVSKHADNPGFELTTVAADLQLKGQP